jgi:hypothetical protein
MPLKIFSLPCSCISEVECPATRICEHVQLSRRTRDRSSAKIRRSPETQINETKSFFQFANFTGNFNRIKITVIFVI